MSESERLFDKLVRVDSAEHSMVNGNSAEDDQRMYNSDNINDTIEAFKKQLESETEMGMAADGTVENPNQTEVDIASAIASLKSG